MNKATSQIAADTAAAAAASHVTAVDLGIVQAPVDYIEVRGARRSGDFAVQGRLASG